MSEQHGVNGAAPRATMTRALLACGVLAGPLFITAYLAQAFTRPGFDIARHPASVLSNGDLGYVQVANFVICGALVILAAIGMRQALRSGRGSTWAPILIGLVGVTMVLAAIFTADPVDGFPPGTPLGLPTTISTMGLLHFVISLANFSLWIAASFVFARRFAALRETGWAVYSTATGVAFLVGFLGGAVGVPVLGFVIAISLGWIWLSATCAKLRGEVPATAGNRSPTPPRPNPLNRHQGDTV